MCNVNAAALVTTHLLLLRCLVSKSLFDNGLFACALCVVAVWCVHGLHAYPHLVHVLDLHVTFLCPDSQLYLQIPAQTMKMVPKGDHKVCPARVVPPNFPSACIICANVPSPLSCCPSHLCVSCRVLALQCIAPVLPVTPAVPFSGT